MSNLVHTVNKQHSFTYSFIITHIKETHKVKSHTETPCFTMVHPLGLRPQISYSSYYYSSKYGVACITSKFCHTP
jgi:hypothetical protein